MDQNCLFSSIHYICMSGSRNRKNRGEEIDGPLGHNLGKNTKMHSFCSCSMSQNFEHFYWAPTFSAKSSVTKEKSRMILEKASRLAPSFLPSVNPKVPFSYKINLEVQGLEVMCGHLQQVNVAYVGSEIWQLNKSYLSLPLHTQTLGKKW